MIENRDHILSKIKIVQHSHIHVKAEIKRPFYQRNQLYFSSYDHLHSYSGGQFCNLELLLEGCIFKTKGPILLKFGIFPFGHIL